MLIFYIVGTLLSAPTVLCCATTRLKSKGKAFCLNIVSAFLQALTCLLIVGWIWSILWAMTFVQLSCKFTILYIYHFPCKSVKDLHWESRAWYTLKKVKMNRTFSRISGVCAFCWNCVTCHFTICGAYTLSFLPHNSSKTGIPPVRSDTCRKSVRYLLK